MSSIVVEDGVKVELEDIGEGLVGNYDENDPTDIPLLRFYVSVFQRDVDDVAEFGDWVDVDDASYCTQLDVRLPQWVQNKAVRLILDTVKEDVLAGRSIKKTCERLSWIDETWVEEAVI